MTPPQKTLSVGEGCAEALSKWDAGDPVWSVEMGGIGPGYEQAIQLMAFEILRSLLKRQPDPATWKTLEGWRDERDLLMAELASVTDKIGPSGAQWGAACNIGAVFYQQGYEAGLEMAPKDRRILCRKHSPSLSEGGKL